MSRAQATAEPKLSSTRYCESLCGAQVQYAADLARKYVTPETFDRLHRLIHARLEELDGISHANADARDEATARMETVRRTGDLQRIGAAAEEVARLRTLAAVDESNRQAILADIRNAMRRALHGLGRALADAIEVLALKIGSLTAAPGFAEAPELIDVTAIKGLVREVGTVQEAISLVAPDLNLPAAGNPLRHVPDGLRHQVGMAIGLVPIPLGWTSPPDLLGKLTGGFKEIDRVDLDRR